jgi:hypothetical protein
MPYPLAGGSELVEDLGFLGHELPGVQHTRPIKKPKGRRLTKDKVERMTQIIAIILCLFQ